MGAHTHAPIGSFAFRSKGLLNLLSCLKLLYSVIAVAVDVLSCVLGYRIEPEPAPETESDKSLRRSRVNGENHIVL